MNVTERELDAFIDEVERLGYVVEYGSILSYGTAEVVIHRNGARDPYEFGYDIRQIVSDLGFRDFDMHSESMETIVIELF